MLALGYCGRDPQIFADLAGLVPMCPGYRKPASIPRYDAMLRTCRILVDNPATGA